MRRRLSIDGVDTRGFSSQPDHLRMAQTAQFHAGLRGFFSKKMTVSRSVSRKNPLFSMVLPDRIELSTSPLPRERAR